MRVKRKITDSSLKRGRAAERRLADILHSLRRRVPWIGCARLAGKKHDQRGIDLFVSMKPVTEGENIIVPVQIKSSLCGLIKHYKKYLDSIVTSLLVIVVNEGSMDEDIELRLLGLLSKIRES